jgi:hypothetical protein
MSRHRNVRKLDLDGKFRTVYVDFYFDFLQEYRDHDEDENEDDQYDEEYGLIITFGL